MMCSSFGVSPSILSKMSFGYFLNGANTRTASVFSLHFYFLIECGGIFSWQQIPFLFPFHCPKNPFLVDLFGFRVLWFQFIVFWLSLYSFLWFYWMCWK
jgi:hypothetical protein